MLGTRARAPFRGVLLGSVSQSGAALADCPVVIIKRSDGARPDEAHAHIPQS